LPRIERSRRKRPDTLDAYDLMLRALPKQYAVNPQANAEAYELLAEAVQLDPTFAPALGNAAFTLENRTSFGWPDITGDDRGTAFLAIAAVTIGTVATDLAGISSLNEGDKVSFELETGRDGKASATNLKLLR
jgi:hypothetical protein